jgi:CheY-like chemotaxis protein
VSISQEALRRMRAEPRTELIPVVILTSSVEEQDLIRGYKLGCNSYIRKPVDFDQFSLVEMSAALRRIRRTHSLQPFHLPFPVRPSRWPCFR